MSSKLNGTHKPEGDSANPTLLINAQYVKDLSFENPREFKEFKAELEDIKTQINVEVGCNTDKTDASLFEITLRVEGKIFQKETPLYLIELTYAGLFTISNFPEDIMQFLLFVECPRLIFPFARNIISQITQESGFPPIYLAPIDFSDLLKQRLQAQGKEGSSQSVVGSS